MEPLTPVLLCGASVRLEPLALDHLAGLLEAATGPRESFALTTVPPDALAMKRYIATALEWHARGAALPFATVDARTDRVVGSTRFGNVERWDWPAGSAHARPPACPDAVEIGWTWLHPSAQRTAINTEAKLLLLGHAFEAWRVHRVTLKTDARNARSRAAIARLGARLDGVLRGHMPAADGGVRDSAVYSLVASEWPTVQARLRERLGIEVRGLPAATGI
jgi:RimJ/RimL family protein N-acetyltransferase